MHTESPTVMAVGTPAFGGPLPRLASHDVAGILHSVDQNGVRDRATEFI